MPDIDNAQLTKQCYGIATAGTKFGRASGIWLECKGCPESQVIIGSNSAAWMQVSDAEVAKVFRRHGWTGEGNKMVKALCPTCSEKVNRIAQAIHDDLTRQIEEPRPDSPFVGDCGSDMHCKIDGDVNMRALAIAAFRAMPQIQKASY